MTWTGRSTTPRTRTASSFSTAPPATGGGTRPSPPAPAAVQPSTWTGGKTTATATIYSYAVVYDTPIAALQADQPFNCAVIELDHAPGINFLSHLPGQAPGDVPIGGKVKLTFEATPATGQKVPEWTVVKT